MLYPYSPLDYESSQTRTLTIAPSEDLDSEIRCSIDTISLSTDKGTYEALSYFWGASKETTTIHIDGHSFPVTRNLGTALRYLRRSHDARVLWIDAVCINQDDVAERNVQVRRMGQIYSHASCVLIWLGDCDVEVEATMSKLEPPDALEHKSYDDFPDDIAAGLSKMLKKPWWHRVWTIQELILADADPWVGVGKTWLKWEKLYEAVLEYSRTMMDRNDGMIRDNESSWVTNSFDIIRHILLRKQWKEGQHLDRRKATASEMVERTRGYQCTDKRDQVYGVRDLICEEEKAFYPSPDYGKSVSEVYQEAMVAMFKSKNSLTFLIHAVQSGHDRERTLPSWCADFAQKDWDMGLYESTTPMRSRDEDEKDAKGPKDLFAHNLGSGALKVRAAFLGNVVVSRPLVPNSAWDQGGVTATVSFNDQVRLLPREEAGKLWVFTQFAQEVARMGAIAFNIWERRHGKQKAKELLAEGNVWKLAYGRHLLFSIVDAACVRAGVEQVDGDDRPYDYWNVEAFVRESCPWYIDALREMDMFHATPDLPQSTRLRRGLWESLLVVTQMNFGSWWSITDTGYVTRATREIKNGDQLCEIVGCRQPMLLRPREGNMFELVSIAQSDDFDEEHYRTHLAETAEKEVILM